MGAADEVLAAVQAGGLLPPDRPVVVLLSGGRDSVCLLDVATRLAGADAVTALHVNYGLRDAAADDERHCTALCGDFGVPLVVERPAPGREPGNVQGWARDVRYEAAAQLAGARGARVATGHTATDQAETVLYRLAASPGRRALLGMAADDGLLVRPLLPVTRDQTAAYCRARNLAWREDATNEDGTFARGRVRHRLVPALREVHPAAEQNVLRTAELLRDEAAVLDALVDQVLDGREEIDVERLAELPPGLSRLVMRRLAEDALGSPAPRVAGRADEILALGEAGALDLGDGARARVRAGILRFERSPRVADRGEGRGS